ncbi:kinase-like protein [Westerdykella ornata]|uniref:Kinase-like protein n=1 Tax=Westerdykella ornata TaxID=318751 RepID=A0A6A6J6K1_WESOR|nr:kinase-like protein [Westerdykella ornata]KAF2272201.1 kinase-like protein [Westerdykella ornata]
MDYSYSPHCESGGAIHLPSPTHRHNTYGGLSLEQIRRSLSHSPSKPSRFHLRKTDSFGSPISPLALSRAFSPTKPLFETPSPQKKRITLRRSNTPLRSSPRNHPASHSPRRALSESNQNVTNSTPITVTRFAGEENMTETDQAERQEPSDKPIKYGLSRLRNDVGSPGNNFRATPLKRSDGIMNLDAANVGSPLAKRRSVHGASVFGPDFDVFDQPAAPGTACEEPSRPLDFGSPVTFSSLPTQTPLRKSSSLRKSTLSQRTGSTMARSKPVFDGEFAGPGTAPSKLRQRMSLDGPLNQAASANQSPLRRSTQSDVFRPSAFLRPAPPHHQPHPLSIDLTTSISAEAAPDNAIQDAPVPLTFAPRKHIFSRSLPLGISRPTERADSLDGSFETPSFKATRPNPEPFMSTGLFSKKNRNLDIEAAINRYNQMPGTPSKRNSFPPPTASPSFDRRPLFFGRLQRPEFGQTSTPFSVHKQSSSLSFGKGVGIFGSFGSKTQRRSSFADLDSEGSHSPCGNVMTDSQSSSEDLPPTPTKPHEGPARRKDSSLRRQTFHHTRVSLNSDTFAAPAGSVTPTLGAATPTGHLSPHTPSESFTPPDPSTLSITGRRKGSMPLNASTSTMFPPATPTAPRDGSHLFDKNSVSFPPFSVLGENDVDISLYERFDHVTFLGDGEFSVVYRAEKVGERGSGFSSSPRTHVYAVKKTKKPFTGPSDKEKKMREVQILEALCGHDHIISLEDHWEQNGHLFIQTEFCEEGNLQRFLDHAGNKGRIDDFRIWKILLEVTLGVRYIHDKGFIHLDLKPANILITFDGCLKIADFGLATSWPAPSNIDGEGDRHYLAPEALGGRYDKPCDIFALGIIMCEVASNYTMPENGDSWQRLRRGDLSDLPSLTWSSESSLDRDVNGEPIESENSEGVFVSDDEDATPKPVSAARHIERYSGGLAEPPNFMIDDQDPDSLQQIVQWMLNGNPDLRPNAEQLYRCYGCQWVERRSRAGATIYEGNWGPADDVLDDKQEDVDRMDTD